MPKWTEVINGIGFEVEFSPGNHCTVYDRDRTVKRQLAPVITNYSCRACGATEFEAIHEQPEFPKFDAHTVIGPGPNAGMPVTNTYRITGYRCPNCTARFDDPLKWSKNQPPEVVPVVATPSEDVIRIRHGLPSDHVFPKLDPSNL